MISALKPFFPSGQVLPWGLDDLHDAIVLHVVILRVSYESLLVWSIV